MKVYVKGDGRMAVKLACPSCHYELEIDFLDILRKCPLPKEKETLKDVILQEVKHCAMQSIHV